MKLISPKDFALPARRQMPAEAAEPSVVQTIVPNALVAVIMLVAGFILAWLAGLSWLGVPRVYVEMYAAVTLVGVLIWTFVAVARLAIARADVPLSELFQQFRPRLPLLILPALIAPLFLAGYTIAKTSVARLVPVRWDAEWAALDRWIFGVDPWRISHAWLGRTATAAMVDFYTMVWGGALVISAVAVTLIAGRRLIGRFFLAMSMAWMTGGILLASFIWAAGPVFAPHFDPSLSGSFGPLQQALAALLDPNSPVLVTQKYLLRELGVQAVAKGGGISAMPSMHIAAATIYVLASWRTLWLVPSLVFLALTFVGSVHFGYHYAVDAPVAMLVAILCWKLTGWWFPRVSTIEEAGARRSQ